jgi:hypothetical protein
MSTDSNVQPRKVKAREGEGIFAAISLGVLFIIIGVIYISTPGLWDSIVAFFSNLTLAQFPGTGIYLPAPSIPSAHAVLYGAVFQFCLGIGILQILILALRLALHSPVRRTAETVGNLVFWFGASYLVNTYLNGTATVNKWFVFWAGVLVFIGLSLIARAFVLLAKR